MHDQKQNVMSLLNVGSDDTIHMVGIHGIGGIGKTTLALEVYNSIADRFEGSCFLKNIRENSEKHGLPYLQKILLFETVQDRTIELTSEEQGMKIIQQRLQKKKVLLLLDDVDNLKQLKAIAGSPNWFGPGSRVIITTRDIRLLTCHGVKKYEVKVLNDEDAFDLVGWKALKNNYSPSYKDILLEQKYGRELDVNELRRLKDLKNDKGLLDYAKVLKRAVAYASGLPLALELIGSHFFERSIEDCESTLDRYERVPHQNIQTTLRLSYDALSDEEKSVFLDIACCFKGYKLTRVQQILHAHHGDIMKDQINVLVEKSLIKISVFDRVTLHDLVEDMGKEIVRQESPKDPGKRSRLWNSKDIKEVLEENKGTSIIDIIHLDHKFKVEWHEEAFKKMENLKTLIIRDVDFSESPKHLPNSLRVLECRNRTHPSSDYHMQFEPKHLFILPPSNPFKWELFLTKKFKNMRVLNLDYSEGLAQIPDISGFPNLEEFSIQNCRDLIAIDKSVGLLRKLKILRFIECTKIQSVPPLSLASLEQLYLFWCPSLESFPEVVDGFGDKLKIMRVRNCDKLRSIPLPMLSSLEELDVLHCKSLESFQPVVDGFGDKLKIMRIFGCDKLRSIPLPMLSSLEQFDVYNCNSLESFQPVVDGFGNKLKTMRVRDCDKLRSIPPLIMLSSLEELVVYKCKSLESFPILVDEFLGKLKTLTGRSCHNVKSIPPLMMFANVKELHLTNNPFTVIPKSIEKCHFLWKLILDDCEELQEIKGIPPRLRMLSALNCKSLTLSCKSKLLNRELHETGNTWFRLPRAKIPEWFDHQCSAGLSISFWFRNKFPAIALCVVSPLTWRGSIHCVRVTVNGNIFFIHDPKMDTTKPDMYHLHLFHMQMENFNDNMDKALLENKWNHAEVDFGFPFQKSGIHVLKEKSNVEDIRFTKPGNDDNTVYTQGVGTQRIVWCVDGVAFWL